MNKAILVGRLTKDPDVRTMQNGTEVASFTIAIDRPFTNQSGERQADFINCVAFRQASFVQKYFHKGSVIAVDGRIQTRSYKAQDGSNRYVTEIVCDSVNFVPGSKNDGSSQSYNPTEDNEDKKDIETTDLSKDPYEDFGSEVNLSDDDLPF